MLNDKLILARQAVEAAVLQLEGARAGRDPQDLTFCEDELVSALNTYSLLHVAMKESI